MITVETWLVLDYKDSGENFDEYFLTGFTNEQAAEFIRGLFMQEIENPEGLIFYIRQGN